MTPETTPIPEANEKDSMERAIDDIEESVGYSGHDPATAARLAAEKAWRARAALPSTNEGMEALLKYWRDSYDTVVWCLRKSEAHLAKVTAERDRLATDALAEISGAGICTPAEGYVEAPFLLAGDIRMLAARAAFSPAKPGQELKLSCGHPGTYGFGSYCALCENEKLKAQLAEKDSRIKDLEARCGMFSGMHAAKSEALIEARIQLAARSAPAPAPDGVRRLILEKIKDDGECDCGFDEPSGEGYAGGICFLHEALLLLEPR